MRRHIFTNWSGRRTAILAGVLTLALAAVPTHASWGETRGSRSAIASARADLMRVHIRLIRAAESDPAVIEARDAARTACAALYQIRQNVLAGVRKSPEYADLRMALWAKQRQILGLYDEIPTRVQSIVGSAHDAMELRSKLGAIETAALEADPAFVEARDDANAKLNLQQKTLREALDGIRSNNDFIAASARVQSMQRSITGYTNAVASAR